MSFFLKVKPSFVDLSYSSSGLEVGGVLNVTVGSPVSITCNVVGSKPIAEIFWNLDGIELLPDGTQENTTNALDPRLADSTSNMTLTGLSLDHHGASLSCRAVIPPDSIGTTATATLNVKGNPGNIQCSTRRRFSYYVLDGEISELH